MTTTFPNAVDSFDFLEDGTDSPLAAHQNDRADAIVATQNYLLDSFPEGVLVNGVIFVEVQSSDLYVWIKTLAGTNPSTTDPVYIRDFILKRLLRVYPYLPPYPGGLEKHVLMLSLEQKAMGLTVAVAFSEGEEISSEDIRVLGKYRLRVVRPRILRDVFFYVALIFRILKNKRRFDAVHLHGD